MSTASLLYRIGAATVVIWLGLALACFLWIEFESIAMELADTEDDQ